MSYKRVTNLSGVSHRALVDMAGPGVLAMETTSIQAIPVGKPGEWSVASFLDAV